MIFLSDNTDCPNWSGPLEDNDHFLFICPKFLLDSTQIIIPKNNNVDINIDLLLHGNISFPYDLNIEILQAVHKFISDTRRFYLRCFFFSITLLPLYNYFALLYLF